MMKDLIAPNLFFESKASNPWPIQRFSFHSYSNFCVIRLVEMIIQIQSNDQLFDFHFSIIFRIEAREVFLVGCLAVLPRYAYREPIGKKIGHTLKLLI